MKLTCLALFCIALLGCQKSTQESVLPSPEVELEAQGTKTIGEAEARSAITRFVNEQLKGKTYVAGKQAYPYPKIEPSHWSNVESKGGRWIANYGDPSGPWVTASVDENGKTPRLQGYGFMPY